MATIEAAAASRTFTAPTVRTCYDLMTVAPACGVTDLTDGKYLDDRNDRAAYLAAQERQAEYLLDQVRCGPGTRLLDIGCGYGRILEHAARRGATAMGITISPSQVANCRARGLTVFELNYRDILTNPPPTPHRHGGSPTYKGGELEFDAIVANGSLEHFVQVADAAAGRADEIYEEMFAICRRLVADGGRLVTTAIHFREAGQFNPAEIMRGPYAHPRRSPHYQFAMLAERFGGWYPAPGQLERCAAGQFDLVEEDDGTHDYHLTSEFWLRRFTRKLAYDPRVWWAVARQLWQRPRAAWEMLRLQLWDQSWAWQFRPPAPMRLLRQTWVAK
ncbi:MAG: class I SAM-dependent methyltransferase [Planctomycetes bacterium]|nr:class I SAM-dependent methyltransferase [Planctomycetota bacterium]